MQRRSIFKICRFNPEYNNYPYIQVFSIPQKDCQPMMLDNLFLIQHTYDATLSFRRSCREGICGSCAMNINGINTLACIYPISQSTTTYLIYPLSHMPILKDLIVSLKHFYSQYRSIEPWLQIGTNSSLIRTPLYSKWLTNPLVFKQHKLERKLLDGVYECILCACCSTSCPSYWWNPDSYLGPAILLQAFRWIIDTRDTNTKHRLEYLNDTFKLYRCHTIMNCTATCPKNLNPAEAISNIKRMIHSSLSSFHLKHHAMTTLNSEYSAVNLSKKNILSFEHYYYYYGQ